MNNYEIYHNWNGNPNMTEALLWNINWVSFSWQTFTVAPCGLDFSSSPTNWQSPQANKIQNGLLFIRANCFSPMIACKDLLCHSLQCIVGFASKAAYCSFCEYLYQPPQLRNSAYTNQIVVKNLVRLVAQWWTFSGSHLLRMYFGVFQPSVA